MAKSERIAIENVIRPGRLRSVDTGMYQAMKQAFLKVLPKRPPGLTVAEIQGRVTDHLPETLYPGGAKAGWWQKAVQLDLEAKGIIAREKTSPIRLYKV